METDEIRDELRLRELMAIRGISPQELADKTGISKPVIYKYMSGDVWPPADKFRRLREALGVSPGEMFAGEPLSLAPEPMPELRRAS